MRRILWTLTPIIVLLLIAGRITAASSRTVDIRDADTLKKALKAALPGDILVLQPGDYSGRFVLKRSGSADAPITLTANGHARLIGTLFLNGDYLTVSGLEITDPDNIVKADSALEVNGNQIAVINNVVHDACNKSGIGAWYYPNVTGPGQMYYGNILYHNGCNPKVDPATGRPHNPPHEIYAQNDVTLHGTKVFENNMVFEPSCVNWCFSFHAYAENEAKLTGFTMLNNLFSNAKVLMGGKTPTDQDIWRGNVFLGGSFFLGWAEGDPAQKVDVEHNDFWDVTGQWVLENNGSGLSADSNDFVDGSVDVSTAPNASLFAPAELTGNVYSGAFTQKLGKAALNLAAPGTLSPAPVVQQNRYDSSVYYVAMPENGTLALAGDLKVYDPKDTYGAPIQTGTNQADLTAGLYVVRVSALTTPPLPPQPQPTTLMILAFAAAIAAGTALILVSIRRLRH